MPPKIRELLSRLEEAGFVNRGGKGSHRNYEHPNGARVTLSGKLSDYAKPYLISKNLQLFAEIVIPEWIAGIQATGM